MPRITHGLSCPRCGAGPFKKEASLLKHMNHPFSKCASLIHTAPAPEEATPNNPSLQTPLTDYVDPDGWPENYPEDVADPVPIQEEPISASRFEPFPSASKTFGRAQSFMDQFDSDRYASERKNNLYFPWASKGDYALGAWLLRSGLSMQAINEFLALELVCRLIHSFIPVILFRTDQFTSYIILVGKGSSCVCRGAPTRATVDMSAMAG